MKGILLDKDGDIKLTDGSMSVGDSLIQNASLVLELNQGEVKEDPLLGPSLIRFIRGKKSQESIFRQIKIHLKRAGINYDDLKDKINISINENKQ